MAEKHGVEAASEIAEFEKANVNAVSTYIRSFDVDCDFVLTRAIDVQLSEKHNEALKRRYDGFITAGGQIAKEATYVDGEDAERVRRNSMNEMIEEMLIVRCSSLASKAQRVRIITQQAMCGHTNSCITCSPRLSSIPISTSRPTPQSSQYPTLPDPTAVGRSLHLVAQSQPDRS